MNGSDSTLRDAERDVAQAVGERRSRRPRRAARRRGRRASRPVAGSKSRPSATRLPSSSTSAARNGCSVVAARNVPSRSCHCPERNAHARPLALDDHAAPRRSARGRPTRPGRDRTRATGPATSPSRRAGRGCAGLPAPRRASCRARAGCSSASRIACGVISWNTMRFTGTFGSSTSSTCQPIASPSRSSSVARMSSSAPFSACFSSVTTFFFDRVHDVRRRRSGRRGRCRRGGRASRPCRGRAPAAPSCRRAGRGCGRRSPCTV